MAETTSSNPVRLSDMINSLWRRRKQLIILALITIAAAAFFSSPLFLKPRYKSTVIFYPTTNNSISNALLTELNQRQKDPLEFGEEEEAEKALQVLQSSKLKSRLARNFRLMEHYKINPNSKTKFTELGDKMDDMISFSRTRYLSIRVDVMDEDPKMAADMANGISKLYDSVKTEMQREVAIPALQIVERALKAKEAEVEDIKTKMRELGTKGVTNYEEQSRALAEEVYKARALGKSKLVEELIAQEKNLIQFGGDYVALQEQLVLEKEKESNIRAKYDRAKVDVEESLTHKFIVDDAAVAEKKAWPVRWLIVAYSLFFVMSIAAIAILIADNLKSSQPQA